MEIIKQQEVLGKEFKIYGTFENLLFKATDVAIWIEHSNVSSMISDLELEEEKIKLQISTLNNSYSAWFLTEDGLYEVLMQSRKSIAKEFKKEVKKILKEIRIKGSYTNSNTISLPKTYSEALQELLDSVKETERLTQQIREEKPLVEFAKNIQLSEDYIDYQSMAKLLQNCGIKLGRNSLLDLLRNRNILMSKGKRKNIPYQRYVEQGYFRILEDSYFDPFTNENHIKLQSVILPKGQKWIINSLLKLKEQGYFSE